MQTGDKRTVQINVKLSAADFALLQKTAQILWPDAVISNSGILLGLAKITAKRVIDDSRSTKTKRN